MKAIRMHETGDPEVMRLEEVDDPRPAQGGVTVRVAAAGVNFIDLYRRSGAYPVDLPQTPGSEGAGVIEAIGDGVTDLHEGDQVAWAAAPGSYAEMVSLPAAKAVPVPDGVDLQHAAAVMLQGMTAHYLASSTFPLREGHTALVHAGAGGVGRLLVQIAKRRGARVLTTVSTDEKERLAREAGADEVIRYTETDSAEAVARLTDGGVDVVYDSVGKDTFDKSLDSLRPRGYLVLYGQSSGAVGAVDPQVLNAKGGLFLTRPSLAHYTLDRAELSARARDLFEWMAAGELDVRVDRTWPLVEAAEAHRYLADRRSKGKLLLLP
ncbi:MAG: quinone oxidoreductase [Actinomycetota bacterium]|nr:quinone oxidoreductase [Actinomycetota bacterium]